MKLPRRKFLHLAAGALTSPAIPNIARAQAYPSRPVRIIVGVAAAGTQDILARLFGQWLSERLGQPFVVENRTGGGGNIAVETVIRAAPDGYTLLTIGPANAANATLYDKLSFNFIRDIAPIASMTSVADVLEVNPAIPVRSVPEFIAYAKANPGKLNMASGGNGTSQHLAGELFKMLTGISMQHVPYRGAGAALPDLIGGQVQVMFDNVSSSIEHIRAGKLRPLAVSTATRWEGLPDIPTIGEFVPGYEVNVINGIGAPANTPAPIIERLNKEINAGLADPKLKGKLAELGATTLIGTPADYARLIAEETEKWGKVIKFAGVKAE
jgi:tripartite-type tricarboxylate transporter receptor subunit TctC